jgi:threonine dehydrogenase-like Zn-dependent dehydrogenase
MRQLTCTAPGRLDWRDVEISEPVGPGEALIRPVAVARCEIDPMLIRAGPTTPGGFAVGHEAVAEVVQTGFRVGVIAVGQLVFPSFQLCCGRCGACTGGRTANCEEYPVLSDYGMQTLSGVEYGGMLSDLVRVPHADAMLTVVPPGLDPVRLASVADNVSDGYRAVAPHLAARPGADVLVVCHGAPSIAIYAVQAAVALGASSVTFECDDAAVLDVASSVGATAVQSSFGRRAGRWPIVVDCGERPVGLRHAIASTEPDGVLHSVSYYAAQPEIPFALGKLYTWGIQFHIGRLNSAAVLPEVVALIGAGRLHPEVVTSDVIGWDEAPARYLDPAIKLVVAR